MKLVEAFLLVVVAALHIYFLVLEMFLWTTPFGQKAFHITESFARDSAVLAANQGLYNGFLATGILLSFFMKQEAASLALRRFVLGCVIVAGVYGGFTVGIKIFVIQAIPAVLALGVGFLRLKSKNQKNLAL